MTTIGGSTPSLQMRVENVLFFETLRRDCVEMMEMSRWVKVKKAEVPKRSKQTHGSGAFLRVVNKVLVAGAPRSPQLAPGR